MMRYFCGILFLWSAISYSAAMPVIDFAALAKLTTEINDLEHEINQLDSLYRNAENQLNIQTQLKNNLEGHYQYGTLFNDEAALQQREWQPSDWQGALKGLSGGNPERYQQLVTTYQQQHPVMTANQYSQGASQARTTLYQQNVELNQVASVQATYSYDELNDHFNTVHQLSLQIEQAPNEKSIADLQARLLTEIAYIEMAELRMQTLLNQQFAQQRIIDTKEDELAAQFNTLPPT